MWRDDAQGGRDDAEVVGVRSRKPAQPMPPGGGSCGRRKCENVELWKCESVEI